MPESSSHRNFLFFVVFCGFMCVNPSDSVGQVIGKESFSGDRTLGEAEVSKHTSHPWYDQKNRRNPFLPLVSGKGTQALASQATRESPSIIFTQRVLGITLGSSGYWALIQGEGGHRHLVQVGSLLPSGGAKVTSISQEEVVLEWPLKMNVENDQFRQQVLKLGKSP
jgi:Tfp pilus assembly protein PilP